MVSTSVQTFPCFFTGENSHIIAHFSVQLRFESEMTVFFVLGEKRESLKLRTAQLLLLKLKK
jgi:hypothetical protein